MGRWLGVKKTDRLRRRLRTPCAAQGRAPEAVSRTTGEGLSGDGAGETLTFTRPTATRATPASKGLQRQLPAADATRLIVIPTETAVHVQRQPPVAAEGPPAARAP
jgi:hypothetical protein